MRNAIPFRNPGRQLPIKRGSLQAQRGVVLVITLIVLVAMILASIAMIRSVDTSTVIAGNLAFKQSAAVSGDVGMEEAIAWLEANGALENHNPADGYYASSMDGLDLIGNKTPGHAEDDLDWTNTELVKILPKDASGNQYAYVIHRMCDQEGALDGGRCSVTRSQKKGVSMGSAGSDEKFGNLNDGGGFNKGYYRITVRINGPRNTAGYVQAIVAR